MTLTASSGQFLLNLIEAVILVLSGKLDGMEDESEDEDDKLLPDSWSKSAETKAY